MSVLSIHGLAVSRNQRAVVDGLSCSAGPGEVLALTGPSGAGKSTVLRAIAGLDAFSAGRIDIGSVRLTAGVLPTSEVRRDLYQWVGMVFQFHNLFEHMTTLENVCLAPIHVRGQSKADAVARAHVLLQEFGVAHLSEARPHQLSGGEAQRVAIARALAMEPRLLLMDEPTASLDGERRSELVRALKRTLHGGRALAVASHDAEFVHALADVVVALGDGPPRVTRRGPEVS